MELLPACLVFIARTYDIVPCPAYQNLVSSCAFLSCGMCVNGLLHHSESAHGLGESN